MKLATDYDAFVMALVLVVTAPSEEAERNCTRRADELAAKLSPGLIRRAKLEAQSLLRGPAA